MDLYKILAKNLDRAYWVGAGIFVERILWQGHLWSTDTVYYIGVATGLLFLTCFVLDVILP